MEQLRLLFFFKHLQFLKFSKSVTNTRIAGMFVEIIINLRMRIFLLLSAAAPENICELFHSSKKGIL